MGESKKQEEKFDRFWELIQKQAKAEKAQFFMDCGEGREFETDDMEGEDISGWLIPKEQVAKFQKEWETKSVDHDIWSDYIRFAEWRLQGKEVTVEFVEY